MVVLQWLFSSGCSQAPGGCSLGDRSGNRRPFISALGSSVWGGGIVLGSVRIRIGMRTIEVIKYFAGEPLNIDY